MTASAKSWAEFVASDAKCSKKKVDTFMKMPGRSVEHYMSRLTDEEKEYYMREIHMSDEMVDKLRATPQRSGLWLGSRRGCCTASNGSAFVGHSPYKSVISVTRTLLLNEFTSNVNMQFGVENEAPARETYVHRMQRIVRNIWLDEKKWITKEDGTKGILFAKRFIPFSSAKNECPIFAVNDGVGSYVHPQFRWCRGSPDGICSINGIVIGMIEIKCSLRGPHIGIKLYYYDQIILMMILARLWEGDVDFADYVTFDSRDFNIERFNWNQEYAYNWFFPRVVRYYFMMLFPSFFYHGEQSDEVKAEKRRIRDGVPLSDLQLEALNNNGGGAL